MLGIIGGQFLFAARSELLALAEALATNNWPAVVQLARSRKGLVGNLAAKPIEDIFAGSEPASQNQTAARSELIVPLRKEWEKLCDALGIHLTQRTLSSGQNQIG